MDKLKAAFKAAGGGMLPEPFDKEWQALLEWSRPGVKPPPTAVSYAVRRWHRDGRRPRAIPRKQMLRIGDEIIGLDLSRCDDVFQRGPLWQIDKLVRHIGEKYGVRLVRFHSTRSKACRTGHYWTRVIWSLSAELVIAKILGKTIGGIDRGFELPWDTINPCNSMVDRASIRSEISALMRSTLGLAGARADSGGDGAFDNGSGRDDPDDSSGSFAKREPKRRRLAATTPPPTSAEVIASQPSNAGQPNSDRRSERPAPTDVLQPKPADPQVWRASVKDVLSKALELVDTNWDDYHEKLASAQNEVNALRAEVALKDKRLEEYEQQAFSHSNEMNNLREVLESRLRSQEDRASHKYERLSTRTRALQQVETEHKAENERMKKELDRVLVENQERNAKLAAIDIALREYGAIRPALEHQVSVKQEGP
ncbi:hypothetical protein RB595_001421 [Gaeumannomyces hyphopodioides]